MPSKRFDNLHKDKRDAILNAARTSFIENGYDNASLNEIIQLAGISKGSFYYYFEDKSDLYITVLKQEYYRVLDDLGDVFTKNVTDDYWSDIREYFLQLSLYSFENPDVMRLLNGYYALSTADMKKESFQEFFKLNLEIADSILTRGQKLGEVRTDLPNELMNILLFRILETMDQWTLEHLDISTQGNLQNMSLKYVDLFRRITSAKPLYEEQKK